MYIYTYMHIYIYTSMYSMIYFEDLVNSDITCCMIYPNHLTGFWS